MGLSQSIICLRITKLGYDPVGLSFLSRAKRVSKVLFNGN